MLITRKSPFSGIETTKDLDVTQEDFDKWRSGAMIQDAFPQLSADDREFILTGITPEEWEATFSDEEKK